MQEHLTLKIRLQPYLRAFLINVYGKGGVEPLFIPKKDPLSRYLNHALIKRPVDANTEDLTSANSIEIVLPFWEWHSPLIYNYLTDKSLEHFQTLLKDLFWTTYILFSNKHYLSGGNVSIVAHLFIQHYELPDDDQLENNLRKYIYRNQYKNVKAPIRNYSKPKF